MIAFWIAAVLMFCGAMMFLLPSMLRSRVRAPATAAMTLNLSVLREQLAELDAELRAGAISPEQYAEARSELEQRALQDCTHAQAQIMSDSPGPGFRAAAVTVLVALSAFGTYVIVGAPEALSTNRSASAAGEANHALNGERIVALIEGLAARLRLDPENGEGWAMLARSYGVLGRHQDALIAYQNAVKRIGGNAQLLVDYADTLALLRGRKLTGEPYELVKRALAIDPRNLKALALAGTAEFEAGNPESAIVHWEKLLPIVPADAPFAKSIAGSIAQARQLSSASAVTLASTASVVGTVRVSASLSARVEPSDTVFVFARAAQGPRMPLAIIKRSASDLPFRFKLDDSMAMATGMKLSQARRVVVGARISRSGSAMPRSGDLEVALSPRKADGVPLDLVIDRVVP